MFTFLGRLLLPAVKDYGAIGINLVLIFIIVFVSWKFFTNHWRHLTAKIDKNTELMELVVKSTEINTKDIAFIKGKLS